MSALYASTLLAPLLHGPGNLQKTDPPSPFQAVTQGLWDAKTCHAAAR
jgi:hypothetical protein